MVNKKGSLIKNLIEKIKARWKSMIGKNKLKAQMDQAFKEAISAGKQKREEIQKEQDHELRKKRVRQENYYEEQDARSGEEYQKSIKEMQKLLETQQSKKPTYQSGQSKHTTQGMNR